MQDELMLLWQQGASSEPDPEEVARLAAKATVTRFDKMIARRNLREYLGYGAIFAFQAWRAVSDGVWLQAAFTTVCAALSVGYLWSQHRRVTEPDATADARNYQSAMLARIDHQIRLLRTARYWYFLPLYVPALMTMVATWQRGRHTAAILGWAIVSSIFIGLLWLNERVVVRFLWKERAKIGALYRP